MMMKQELLQFRYHVRLLALLFGAFLPFNEKFANVALSLFYVFAFVNYLKNSRRKTFKIDTKTLRYGTLLLIISIVTSAIFFFEYSNLLNTIGRRVTYIISPFIFLLIDKPLLKEVRNNALKGLIIGCVLSSLFLVSNILIEYYYTRPLFSINNDLFNFYHTSFHYTRILDFHPSYYGMYILLALASLYFESHVKSKYLTATAIVVLTTSVMFINSRVIMILFLMLNAFYICHIIYKKTKSYLKTGAIASLTFVVLLTVLFFTFKSTYAYQRIIKESAWEFSNEVGTNYNFKGKGDSRMARWIVASRLIKAQPIWGYGVSSERNVLEAQYKKMNMTSSANQRYNAHNQFLGFFIEGGVLAFLALILFFISNLFFALHKNDIIAIFFMSCVLLICLVENYLIRNSGIIFVSFFSTLFICKNAIKGHD